MRQSQFLTSTAIIIILGATSVWAQSSDKEHQYDSLGRLVVTETTSGPNSGDTQSFCFDEAGNRVDFKSSDDGTKLSCSSPTPTPTPTPTPSPTPTPPPPPANNPPVAQNDSVSGQCYGQTFVNLTANDSDPEGNYPLTLLSIVRTSGSSDAVIVNASTVAVYFEGAYDFSSFTYTVKDSLGATDTATLFSSTGSCGGLPPN